MKKLSPREQGDLGEISAIEWLTRRGAHVFVPIGHSPDIDLVAAVDGQLMRIEVKTSRSRIRHCWRVSLSTKGGNQSWGGVTKVFDPERCDYLFVHVDDGRRWFIPTSALGGSTSIHLGGAKYSEFEIEPGAPLTIPERSLESLPRSGEYRSGQTGRTVNALAKSFVGSNPASPTPIAAKAPIEPTNRERKLGKQGQAVINQKRRLTVPQRAFFGAGLQNGAKVSVRAVGPGRIVVEQIELPDWARAGPPGVDEDAA